MHNFCGANSIKVSDTRPCVYLNVGRFHSSMLKLGLALPPDCECESTEQTADHVLTASTIHRAHHGARGLTVFE